MKLLSLLITILFTVQLSAQSGQFNMMNSEPGEYQIDLKDSILLVCHGHYKWVEKVINKSPMNSNTTLYTSEGAKWTLFYGKTESGNYGNYFIDAWCEGVSTEPIHYYVKEN